MWGCVARILNFFVSIAACVIFEISVNFNCGNKIIDNYKSNSLTTTDDIFAIYDKKKRTSRLIWVCIRRREIARKIIRLLDWCLLGFCCVYSRYIYDFVIHAPRELPTYHHHHILRRMWLSVWRRQCTRLLINKFALRVWVCNIQPALQSTRLLWVRG